MQTAPSSQDPAIPVLQQQMTTLLAHTHDGVNSLQLYPRYFHGVQVTNVVPTAPAEGGTWMFYDNGSIQSLYAMIDGSWRVMNFGAGGAFDYGDGSDGDVTINGTVVLTRDMFYDNLTFGSGILEPNGFKIFAKTSIEVSNGNAIACVGNAGSPGSQGGDSSSNGGSTSGGAGGNGGLALNSGTIRNPGVGANGPAGTNANSGNNVNNGTPGAAETNAILANNGANGGASGSGNVETGGGWNSNNSAPGGAGGLTTQTTKASQLDIVATLVNALGGISTTAASGSGGGGGHGSWQTSSHTACGGGGAGGSGSAGGIVWVASPSITIDSGGSILAYGGAGGIGGRGGNATNVSNNNFGGGGGGGGGGGNGGLLLAISPSYANNGTVNVNGGTGGLGGSGGSGGGASASNGSNGSTGSVINFIPS